jgi:hypothetical protein
VAIALVLSSVFIPTIFIPGISGAYKPVGAQVSGKPSENPTESGLNPVRQLDDSPPDSLDMPPESPSEGDGSTPPVLGTGALY